MAKTQWQRIKSNPELWAAYRLRVKQRDEARRREDPEWHEKQKAYLRDYYKAHKDAAVQRVREWRHKNPGSRSGEHRKARYLLSKDGYAAMAVAQGGLCAICGSAPDGKKRMGVLHVDHDHSNGRVRSLLCHNCNKGLGHFKDDDELLMRAAQYIARHRA